DLRAPVGSQRPVNNADEPALACRRLEPNIVTPSRPPRRRKIKFSSMHMKQQPMIFHSQKSTQVARFMQRILLRNFLVAKQHETAVFAWIFIGKIAFGARSSTG